MKDKTFLIKEAFQFGWKRMNENLGIYIVLAMAVVLSFIGLKMIAEWIGLVTWIFFAILFALVVYVDVGSKKIFLHCDAPKFRDFFMPAHWKAYVVSFVFLLLVIGPIFGAYIYTFILAFSGALESVPFLPYSIYAILFIIAGCELYIYFSRYFMTMSILLETNTKIFEAYKKAGALLKGERMHILLLSLISSCILGISFWILPIAGFVAIPLVLGMWTYVYKTLSK